MDRSPAELAGGKGGLGDTLPNFERSVTALTLVVVGRHERPSKTAGRACAPWSPPVGNSIAHDAGGPERGLFNCGVPGPLLRSVRS